MKKKSKEPTLHDLAVRLCEGDCVEFSGLVIRAKDVPEYECACFLCEMDSLCDKQMRDLCEEVDFYHDHGHYLELVNK